MRAFINRSSFIFSFLVCGLLFVGFQPAKAVTLVKAQSGKFYAGGGKEKKKVSTKPSKRSKQSAKGARDAINQTMKDINARSQVRNYFHRSFNAKVGRKRNFRNKVGRWRWKKNF